MALIGSTEARVDAAWRSLCLAIDRFGASRSVNFRDALINAAVRHLGGWEFACQKSVDDFETWYRKDFARVYTTLLEQGCPIEAAGYLVGETERTNRQWVGKPYGRSGKLYELPAVEEMPATYTPLLESPKAIPGAPLRPASLPKLELKKAT